MENAANGLLKDHQIEKVGCNLFYINNKLKSLLVMRRLFCSFVNNSNMNFFNDLYSELNEVNGFILQIQVSIKSRTS